MMELHVNPEAIQLNWCMPAHVPRLSAFLQQLPADVKARFGPHSFEEEVVRQLLVEASVFNTALLAFTPDGALIAYHLLRKGFLLNEAPRLSSYGLLLNSDSDYTYAPVQDPGYQGIGLGSRMWQVICGRLQQQQARRVFLWGGVQTSNLPAIRFYQKNGFQELGRFEWQGENADMMFRFTG